MNADSAPPPRRDQLAECILRLVNRPLVTDEMLKFVSMPLVTDEMLKFVSMPLVTDEMLKFVNRPPVIDEILRLVGGPFVGDEGADLTSEVALSSVPSQPAPAHPSDRLFERGRQLTPDELQLAVSIAVGWTVLLILFVPWMVLNEVSPDARQRFVEILALAGIAWAIGQSHRRKGGGL